MMEWLIRKSSLILLCAILFTALLPHTAFAQYKLIPQFLYELGEQYYQQQQYDLALEKFEKALLLDPGFTEAKEYIKKIKRIKKKVLPRDIAIEETLDRLSSQKISPVPEDKKVKVSKDRDEIITKALDKFSPQKEPFPSKPQPERKAKVSEVLPSRKISKKPEAKALPFRLALDDSVKATQPQTKLDIEKGKSFVVEGKQISRWLVISPNVIAIERKSSNEIEIKGENIGITLLHLWDIQGRWTFEILCSPPLPLGPTLEEELRLAEEKAQSFKVKYNVSWNLLEQGRRIDELEKQNYTYSHVLTLEGPTPYGDFSATADVENDNISTDLTYLTLNFTEGKWGPFEDFTIRGFDYTPGFANLSFEGVTLRGVMLNSPAFNRKVDYTAFWGREGGGRFGGLSPSLADIKDSFLAGIDFNYTPAESSHYGFSLIRGWGDSREERLNEYNYNADVDYYLDNLDLGYEVAFDSETFGHLGYLTYHTDKLRLTSELRDVEEDFLSSTGYGWRRGELGGLFTLRATPNENTDITSRLDVFQDRLFPSPENDDRFNVDFDFDTFYRLTSTTSLKFDYSLTNELGRISQIRSQSAGIGLSKSWGKLSSYLNYRHQESKHFDSPSLDFINEKVSSGLRFNLFQDMHWYISQELNWLEERFDGSSSRPTAFEVGFDWYKEIPDSPFSWNFRMTYRDEEDTTSDLSFFAGEDYLETFGEVTYCPSPDLEFYLSSRVRNVWAENPNIQKRLEFDAYAGMRLLWDTGFRIQPTGEISGYVYKDLNFDGERQPDEPGVEGVKLWLGKDKSAETDQEGFYIFSKVKARKAFINIDTTALPSGYLLADPVTQEVEIIHGQEVIVDFGITSRSEIYGIVFEDKAGDGKFNDNDKGIKGVVLALEDGTKTVTDDNGRYFFRNVSTGEHTITLELDSLRLNFLPLVPLTKDITLFEGVSFVHNIPVQNAE